MLFFFPKKGKHKEGEIMFAFPEVFENPDLGFKVRENGKVVLDSNDFDYAYIMPLEAKPFEDPRNPANIHHFKAKLNNKGELLYIHHKDDTNNKCHHVHKKDIKEMMDLWGQTYTVLKGIYPELKIEEALKKEGM